MFVCVCARARGVQLLGQLEMLKMSSSQQLPASDQENAASQGEFTAVAADPRLLGQSGLGFGLGSQPSAEEGGRMERELAELRAKISDLEASQIEAMVEKQRLIAENKAAVKSRQRAQVRPCQHAENVESVGSLL
jgi:hypothetical protein